MRTIFRASRWTRPSPVSDMNKYYEAYDQRYRTIHAKGYSWSGDSATPIVLDVIRRFGVSKEAKILEIGCGEGRDARAVLDEGYNLLATDVSPEAIRYCRFKFPVHADCFGVLDCLNCKDDDVFDMIYAVAVIHMLVEDEDRRRFYSFIREHLSENGIALVCSMGDGETEFSTRAEEAFEPRERNHPAGPVMVASTSCRMVNQTNFEREISEAGLNIAEKGMTSAMPDFDNLMYAVVRR